MNAKPQMGGRWVEVRDEALDAMRAVVDGLHLRVEWWGETGEYAAVDTETGLIRYRWRDVGELINQMTGDRMPKNEKRDVLGPGLYAITLQSGAMRYEIHPTVNGRAKYGGRFETLDEARARLAEMRGEAAQVAPSPAPARGEESELLLLYAAFKRADRAYRAAMENFDRANQARMEARLALEAFLFNTGDNDHGE